MAVVAATRESHATAGRRGLTVNQDWGTSAANTDITISSIAGGDPKRLVSVSVKYSANSSTTITVTHNYADGPGGTSYDVLLNSTALSAQTDYVFQPPQDWYMNPDDTITVLAPAVAAATAKVVITTETL